MIPNVLSNITVNNCIVKCNYSNDLKLFKCVNKYSCINNIKIYNFTYNINIQHNIYKLLERIFP